VLLRATYPRLVSWIVRTSRLRQTGLTHLDHLFTASFAPQRQFPYIVSKTRSTTFKSRSCLVLLSCLHQRFLADNRSHYPCDMDPPPYSPRETFTSQDLETASIRSAAPSYVSRVPVNNPPRVGLPPILPIAHNRANSTPSLGAFRNPTWSRTHVTNPTSRAYHSIASRRASALTVQEQSSLLLAAVNGEDAIAQIRKKMDDEERERSIRTKEDPYLVGEEAARENREERLKRENGWEVLERENVRWDWLLCTSALSILPEALLYINRILKLSHTNTYVDNQDINMNWLC
jgi:hypothetical protein